MKQTIIIRDDSHKARAANKIMALPLEPVHEVVIIKHSESRSLAQNRLLWRWYGYVSEDTGMTKDEVHNYYKENYLWPIYLESPERHKTAIERWERIQALYELDQHELASQFEKDFIHVLSTTEASVKEMRLYLNEIDRHAAGLNIWLPRPADRGLI